MIGSYTPDELMELALSERWQDQVTAATRTNITAEVLDALMVAGLHHEVTLALVCSANHDRRTTVMVSGAH
jgi:hypothetical protein